MSDQIARMVSDVLFPLFFKQYFCFRDVFFLFVIRKINSSCIIDFSWHRILNLRLTIVRILKVLNINLYQNHQTTKHKHNSQIHIFNPDCCFICCLVLRMKFVFLHTWTSRNLAFHKDFKNWVPPHHHDDLLR